MMKKYIALLLILTGITTLKSQTVADSEQLFPYPAIPDSITAIQDRYDYYVSHFWDRAPMSAIFSSKGKLAKSFKDYLSPLRFASLDTVKASISALMKSVEKKPDNQLYLARLAEDNLYGDSAEMWSDQLYVQFLKPVLRNKKVSKVEKERYRLQVTQLTNSTPGHPIAPVSFTRPDGTAGNVEPLLGGMTILYFNDPDCTDCSLARIRLQADPRARELLEGGQLRIYALTPGDADRVWADKAVDYPESWIVGANPDLDMLLDLRGGTPSFYIIDELGNLAAKNVTIDTLLNILSRI